MEKEAAAIRALASYACDREHRNKGARLATLGCKETITPFRDFAEQGRACKDGDAQGCDFPAKAGAHIIFVHVGTRMHIDLLENSVAICTARR